MTSARIVILAKAPAAGFAKTRLIPAIGSEGAARLARQMLERTLRTALDADVGTVELCATPVLGHPAWQHLDIPLPVERTEQGEGDLGARMARAARRTSERGEATLLIGTDCPALTAPLLRDAAAALREHDAAMIPTLDGGYALLALRRFHPLLFADMPWSTDAVAFETLCRLGRLGWAVKSYPPLRDIDEPADLAYLPPGWCDEAITPSACRA